MEKADNTRAERFLKLYRQMEGILEKRYEKRDSGSSNVVMEYLKDADSEPVRAEIDLCRRIRNILSHNVEPTGDAVVEPSEGVLMRMEAIIEYVREPVKAINYATSVDKIMFAHPNDLVMNVMRHMVKNGYSHVPVSDQGRLVGVFSSGSLMQFAARKGLSQVRDELRIGEMKDTIGFGDRRGERFLFLPVDATLLAVRREFERKPARNHRLAVVFLTEDGTCRTPVRALLTSWDVLRDDI